MAEPGPGRRITSKLAIDPWSITLISGLAIVWFVAVPGLIAYWWLFGAQHKALPEEFSHLVGNLPSLWWPIIVLIAVLLFRTELPLLFRRLRKWQGFGQTLELEPEQIEQIGREILEAQQELEDQPQAPDRAPEEPRFVDPDEAEVLEASRINPRLGLLRLSAALERALNSLSSDLRLTPRNRRPTSPRQIVSQLVEIGALPTSAWAGFADFWPIRNQIVHGLEDPPDSVVLQLLDIGLSLLRLLRSVPRTISRVLDVVTVYTDPGATVPAHGVKGIILRVIGEEDRELTGVYPITRPYDRGGYVTWAWNMSRVFDEMWYRDEATGAVQQAWRRSAEFVGRLLGDDDVEVETQRVG